MLTADSRRQHGDLLLRGGILFTGIEDHPIRADLAVRRGRILAIGPDLRTADLEAPQVIEVSGHTVVPGLIDCHAHVADSDMQHSAEPVLDRALRTLAEYLRIGITTVRDAAGATPRLREAAARTLRPSPRLICSLMQLSSSRGPYRNSTPEELQAMAAEGIPSPVADGAAAFRAKVREYRTAGAEVIKIFATGHFAMPNRGAHHTLMSGEELNAIVGEAASLGMRVMAHAHGARGIVAAASAGVASIEHGLFLGPAGIEAMCANGTTLVPTLMAAEVLGMPDAAARQRRVMGEAHRRGVRIALGTDCPAQPHGTNLRELSLLVSCGLTPAEALKAATVNAAGLLGLGDRIGALKPGMDADLVVVRGDALDFAQLAERIEAVFVAGVRVTG